MKAKWSLCRSIGGQTWWFMGEQQFSRTAVWDEGAYGQRKAARYEQKESAQIVQMRLKLAGFVPIVVENPV